MIHTMITGPPIADAPHAQATASPAVPKLSWVRRPWFLASALVLITFVAYQPAWRAGFIWDDDSHLTANTALTARHGLRLIWTSPTIARYFPLTLTTFWAERHLWGLRSTPYHLVSLLFHAANVVLVFFLLRRLRIPAAWLAAAIWAVHPVNVQSVAWISELKNAQSGFFFFATLLCFLRYSEVEDAQLRWYSSYQAGLWYVLALLCAAAAMLSNASTAVLALVLLLPVWWLRGYAKKADATRVGPFVAMSWLAAGLALFYQRSQTLADGPAIWQLRLVDRLALAGETVWFYLAKILCPVRLSFVYPRWDIRPLHWWSWLPLAAAVALAVLLWRRRRRPSGRAALFAGAFFLLALAPVLGFVDISLFQYAFVADRFQYLASLGIITLVCGGAAVLLDRAGFNSRSRYALPAAVALLLAALGFQTWRQSRIYHDPLTLWRDTIRKQPRCGFAYYNLGNVFLQQGKIAEATSSYEQAVKVRPDYVDARNNLGNALLQSGRYDEAIDQYEQALRLKPASPYLHCNLAMALEQAGLILDAVAHYNQALQIDPDYTQAHNNLANLFLDQGNLSSAIDHYQQALRTTSESAQLHWNLANAFAEAGDANQAIDQYQQALRIKPDYAAAHANLADVLLQQGNTSNAVEHYEQALRLKPRSPEAHFGLATALRTNGRFEEAFAHYQQALWFRAGPQQPLVRLQPAD